jgi:multisubunit Na+/H+ antiporter MnhE subunit
MTIVLLVLAWLLFLASVSEINQATLGVGFIAAAIFVAVNARIYQAHRHHREIHPPKRDLDRVF